MLVVTLLNVDFSELPRPFIAAIAATAISAAIRPYSMAVAALLFLMNLRIAYIPVSIDSMASVTRLDRMPGAATAGVSCTH